MLLTSILRTVVPAIWGSAVSWLLSVVPALEPLREILLEQAEFLIPILSGLIIGGWYAFWRWLEPKLPDWATRVLLGSSKAPVYRTETEARDIQVTGL